MFKKMAEKLKELAQPKIAVDPTIFGDTLAEQIEWTPTKRGGANFRTHKLAVGFYNRLEFRATVGLKLFCGAFMLFGLPALLIPLVLLITGTREWEMLLFLSLFGLVFSGAGIGMFYYMGSPIVFDKNKGFFWKGRRVPDEVFDTSVIKYFAPIEDIYALQLLSEYCSGDKSSYYSYELNLVLKDGKRINVVDHGNKNALRIDADILAEFLNVPLWDAT